MRIGPLKAEDGTLVTDPKEQAKILNEKVFTVPDGRGIEELDCLVEEEDKLVNVIYSESKVKSVMESLRKEMKFLQRY